MKKIDYNPNSLSHHNENIQYWVTQGIVIDGERYSVEELFVRGNTLYGVISTNKIDFYEYPLATNVTQNKFDPSGILNRLDRLESIPQYKYDDTGVNKRLDSIENEFDTNKNKTDQRLTLLENKPDKDNQELSISGNNLSISGGNTIEIPQPDLRVLDNFTTKEYVESLVKSSKYDPQPVLDRLQLLENRSDKDTVYDDTDLKNRVKTLEDKPNKPNQILSINDRTISISGGNSIELPADKDTIYDDTALKQRVKTLEDKPDKADQTLSINDRTISISNGNSIELPADKDTKYTVKGTGLFMDPDNSIRLDAKPLYYKYDHFDPNNYTRIFPNLDIVRLSSNMRFNGTTDYVKSGEKYQIQGLSGRVFGLTNLVQSYHDVTAKVTYDDEYGKSSDTQSISGAVTDTSGYNSNKFDYRILLSDYLYLNVNLNYDLGRNSDKLTFGYNIDLVFIPESPDRIHTYTKAVEHNEIDSKEPIIISVMDGSKEKYHVEVVINNMGIEVSSRDAFMAFKDPDSGNYVKRGGINE